MCRIVRRNNYKAISFLIIIHLYGDFVSPFFFMSVISYGVSTELDAVNSILMSVGETPVNTLTVQSPEVAIAQKTLRQVCREVQAEGWSYNTENEYPIDLDTNNQCIIPNNVIQLDLNIYQHGKDYDIVRRSDNGIMTVSYTHLTLPTIYSV